MTRPFFFFFFFFLIFVLALAITATAFDKAEHVAFLAQPYCRYDGEDAYSCRVLNVLARRDQAGWEELQKELAADAIRLAADGDYVHSWFAHVVSRSTYTDLFTDE